MKRRLLIDDPSPKPGENETASRIGLSPDRSVPSDTAPMVLARLEIELDGARADHEWVLTAETMQQQRKKILQNLIELVTANPDLIALREMIDNAFVLACTNLGDPDKSSARVFYVIQPFSPHLFNGTLLKRMLATDQDIHAWQVRATLFLAFGYTSDLLRFYHGQTVQTWHGIIGNHDRSIDRVIADHAIL